MLELIVMTGLPLSGKTTLIRGPLANYVSLPSGLPGEPISHGVITALELLSCGISVAVDGRHLTSDSRSAWLEAANIAGACAVSIFLPIDTATLMARNASQSRPLPARSILLQRRVTVKPRLSEGFVTCISGNLFGFTAVSRIADVPCVAALGITTVSRERNVDIRPELIHAKEVRG